MTWLEIFSKTGFLIYPFALYYVAIVIILVERLIYILSERKKSGDLATSIALDVAACSLWEQKMSRFDYLLDAHYNTLVRGLGALKFISTTGPMLGLLGTVWGIVKAFRKIAQDSNNQTFQALAANLWEAILTTGVGIVVAFLAMLALFVINALIKNHMEKLYTSVSNKIYEETTKGNP